MTRASPPRTQTKISETARQIAELRRILADGHVKRSPELIAMGIYPGSIATALREGVIQKLTFGAYQIAGANVPPAHQALASAAIRSSKGVICLSSAAYLCGLIDELPPMVWLALPTGAHVPQQQGRTQSVINWAYRGAFEVGIVSDTLLGVPIRYTSAERTLVDLVRYARYMRSDLVARDVMARFVQQGGDPARVMEVAQALPTPAVAMRGLEAILAPSLKPPAATNPPPPG